MKFESKQEIHTRCQQYKEWSELYTELTPATVRTYYLRLKQFLPRYLDRDFDRKNTLELIGSMRRGGHKHSYINSHLKALKSFLAYLNQSEDINNWGEQLRLLKVKESAIERLSDEEVQALLDAGGKYQILIELLAKTGRRMQEALSLRVCDFDYSQHLIRVQGLKGEDDVWLPIPESLSRALEIHQDTLPYPAGYLFPSNKDHSRPVTSQAVNRELKVRAKKAGIKKNVYAHLLRHSFATNTYNRGAGIDKIQKLLNHKDIKSTQRYAKPSNEILRAAIKKNKLNLEDLTPQEIVEEILNGLMEYQKVRVPGVNINLVQEDGLVRFEARW